MRERWGGGGGEKVGLFSKLNYRAIFIHICFFQLISSTFLVSFFFLFTGNARI